MPDPRPRRNALALVALVALMLLAVPAMRQLGDGHGPFVELARAVSEAHERGTGPIDGNHRLLAAIDRFERRLEESSPVLEHALPWAQGVLTRWGGVGNEQAYLGREGWLVYRPGFDYLLGPPFLDPAVLERRRRATASWKPAVEPDPRPALLDFARQLEARGIELLFLPVPTKLSIHPEVLSARELDAPPQNPSLAPFLAELEAAGIAVLDPAPLLFELARSEPAFLRSDSHWSPAAVDRVAGAIAEKLGELGFEPAEGAPERWLRRSETMTGRGDLSRLLKLDEAMVTPGEVVLEETVEVQTVADRTGRFWRADPRAEILLLGDSFTNVYSESVLHWGTGAGLAEQLAFHLQSPLDKVAIQDGSATAVRERLASELASGRDRLRGKRWVVYQLAVRELAAGDWRPVDLESGR